VVERGGVLTGHGSLNATIDINEGGTLAPSGIVMRPYSLEAPAPGGDDVFTSERFRIGVATSTSMTVRTWPSRSTASALHRH
jgi:hypothetical protein